MKPQPAASNEKPEVKEEENKFSLNDVLGNLEKMSNTSTLLDDFSDDDDDCPPPLRPPAKQKTLNINENKENKNDTSQPSIHGIDPFDMKNFEQSNDDIQIANGDLFGTVKSMKLNDKKIIDYSGQIANLMEELRIKNEEISMLTSQLKVKSSNMNSSMMEPGDDLCDTGYHLAFMFSSPLVRRINSTLEMIMQLDYTNEIKNIEKHLKNVKHEIRYKVDVATISNFRSVIADAPFALHFTGHGVKNDQKALGSAYMQHKNKGDILLMEDEKGMADYLFENDLKKLVLISKANRKLSHNYEVVFVSS